MPLRPGDKLADQYQIESVLGHGGDLGPVYLARDLSLGALRVIKELWAKRFRDEDVQKRFIFEARLMAGLLHPNIVAVYQFLAPPLVRDYCIVMEYMAGGSLDHLLHQEGRLSVDRAVKIAIDICRGLAQAHKQGIVHRDIKPANILLGEGGKVAKVNGWGIVHLPQDPERPPFIGDPGLSLYMSVEQARVNDITIDGRSDLYSVGAVLFDMATGQSYLDFKRIVAEAEQEFHPKLGHSRLRLQWAVQQAIFQAIIEREPERPTRYNPDLPPDLEVIILKALAKDPNDRYQTAEEMIEALDSVLPAKSSQVDKLIGEARKTSKNRQYDQALKILEKAKDLTPNDPRVYREMAVLYSLMKRYDEASQLLQEGLQISPDNPTLHNDLALIYVTTGKVAKAVEMLDRSLRLDPNQSKIQRLVESLRKKSIDAF